MIVPGGLFAMEINGEKIPPTH